MSVIRRNCVLVSGGGPEVVVLSQGLCVDHRVWNRILPSLENRYTVLRYDLTGLGNSSRAAYDHNRHSSLDGHAEDLLEICSALKVRGATFIGHSAGAMVGVLASVQENELFREMVLIGASPRYIDEPGYRGGFTLEQIESTCRNIAADYLGWCDVTVPAAVGASTAPDVTDTVLQLFRRTAPEIAAHLARVILLSDHRVALPQLSIPTLIIQASHDLFVPMEVGKYMATQIPQAELAVLSARGGHYPHLGSPQAVIVTIQQFLSRPS